MARLLLDENVPRSVGVQLALAGHDIALVADVAPQAPDLRVLAIGREQGRVLLTFDPDFGELVFQRRERPPPAIILLRMHPISVELTLALALQALSSAIDGHFVVATSEGVRRRPMPAAGADGDG